MTGFEVWISGTLFGLGAAVPIGPVNVEIARRAVARGLLAALALGMGAVSIDVIYACLAVTGVSVVAVSGWVFWPLAIGSILLLGHLGIASLASAHKARKSGWSLEEKDLARQSLFRAYATGLAMTAINPMTLVFWFTALPGQAVTLSIPVRLLPVLALGVFSGTTAWVISFSSLMALLGRWRKRWWMAAADVMGGVLMLGFAILAVFACVKKAGIFL